MDSVSNVWTTGNFYRYFEDKFNGGPRYLRMFAESLISIMKLHKSLSYFMAAALMFSCSQKLPSYSEFNPIQKPQDQEKEVPFPV